MKKIITNICLTFFFISIGHSQSQVVDDQFDIKILSDKVNTESSNFVSGYYNKNKLLFSSLTNSSGFFKYVLNRGDEFRFDLFVGDIHRNGELHNIEKFSPTINTKYHESGVSLTRDLKTIYFTRNNYHQGKYKTDSLGTVRLKIYKADLSPSGQWSNIRPLPFNSDEYSVGHPTLSDDGKILYFVSDKPGGLGKTDIYKVTILGNDTYGTPENLGPIVNTPEKEMFPFYSKNKLFYSSDGKKNGVGGLDVFVSHIDSSGNFSGSKNLGDKINSPKDDFAFVINEDKSTGYFSSNREGGYGDDDIYFFIKKSKKKCTYTVLVRDFETKKHLSNSMVKFSYNDKLLIEGITDKNGKFTYQKFCEEGQYDIRVKNKPLYNSESIKTTGYTIGGITNERIVVDLRPEFSKSLDKLIVKINTIYFDHDEAFIREDAKDELQKVIRIMHKYPKLKIIASSHTDVRGGAEYNQKLSERRALSTMLYITSAGIAKDRISYKGYGETMLINDCFEAKKCTDAQHQLNRRTEFEIVNPEIIGE